MLKTVGFTLEGNCHWRVLSRQKCRDVTYVLNRSLWLCRDEAEGGKGEREDQSGGPAQVNAGQDGGCGTGSVHTDAFQP